MEKYGTPQEVVEDKNGVTKVASEKLAACCWQAFKDREDISSTSVKCACGNTLTIECR